MAGHPEPSLEEQLWSIAAARLVLPDDVSVQAPPNLAYDDFPRLLDAGIDDWGGISPVTIDHVNPEAPWPDPTDRRATRSRLLNLAARLPVYPTYVDQAWLDPQLFPYVLRASDAQGLAREDRWHPGERGRVPLRRPRRAPGRHDGRAGRGRAGAAVPGAGAGATAGLRRRGPPPA